jgi:hypothetical protein
MHQAAVLRVPNNANYRRPRVLMRRLVPQPHSFTQRILPRKILAHQHFVHNRNRFASRPISLIEIAPVE